jgi:sulfur carrier protein
MIVNGKSIEFADPITIERLLQELKMNPMSVAIELNGEILEREHWNSGQLNSTDRVEIIKFVGGG